MREEKFYAPFVTTFVNPAATKRAHARSKRGKIMTDFPSEKTPCAALTSELLFHDSTAIGEAEPAAALIWSYPD